MTTSRITITANLTRGTDTLHRRRVVTLTISDPHLDEPWSRSSSFEWLTRDSNLAGFHDTAMCLEYSTGPYLREFVALADRHPDWPLMRVVRALRDAETT